jgi:putative PEP-CTERM system histidine kinase
VEWRQINAAAFSGGGHRWCVPLVTGGDVLGAIVLGDRVGGSSYTAEEVDLLRCIGDQIASSLLNMRLTQDVAAAREMEAFRTMSAFFVHDLKNAASSLNLTLKNLPVHFEDPDFRADALKALGNTSRRIDDMLTRLGALRQRRELVLAETDLNQTVREVLESVQAGAGKAVALRLLPLPSILADREQVASVVTNLVMNARDAVSPEGRIEVRTEQRGTRVVLSVSDDGGGMGPEFVRDSLFRPFRSTKKGGLGIGLFQSRAVIQAHGGSLQVETEPGKGTTFHVSLPVKGAP